MDDSVQVTATIDAPAEAVFAVLADPSTHEAIDGTGWVLESLDGTTLTETGQTFDMAMYHDNHPDGRYEMVNRVVAFESPRAIAWEPGQRSEDGQIGYGGWVWRYDLTDAAEGGTDVTLTYDWSGAPKDVRDEISFPPFELSHLENSLTNLAELARKG